VLRKSGASRGGADHDDARRRRASRVDATHEAIIVIPERAVSGERPTRLPSEVCKRRVLPAIIRTDNGKEFTGRGY